MVKVMEKLIIKNYSDLSSLQVMEIVTSVIDEGKVSGMESKKQYCYITTFSEVYQVHCKKNINDSFTFTVTQKNQSGV